MSKAAASDDDEVLSDEEDIESDDENMDVAMTTDGSDKDVDGKATDTNGVFFSNLLLLMNAVPFTYTSFGVGDNGLKRSRIQIFILHHQ